VSDEHEQKHLRLLDSLAVDSMSPDCFRAELEEAFNIGLEDGKANTEDGVADHKEYDRDLRLAYERGWRLGAEPVEVAR
jgi:hypothetical protein